MWTVLVMGLLFGGALALFSIGLTLVFGVMNIVNFAHGEFVMLPILVTAVLTQSTGLSPYAAGAIVLICSVPAALAIYFVVIRPTLGKSLYVQVFATIGLGLVLQAAALMAFGPRLRSIHDDFTTQRVSLLGVTVELGRVIAFIVSAVLALVVWQLLRRSRLGAEVRAVAADSYAARVVGIRVSRAYLVTFVGGVLLAALAGVLIAPFTPINAASGLNFTLMSFVVVVLGGLGSLPGALVGGLVIGVAHTAVGYYLGTGWSLLALFVIFIAVLLIRPLGIFHRGTRDLIFGETRV